MMFQTNTIAIAMLVTAVISLAVTGYCLYRRTNAGAMQLGAVMAAVTVWALGAMLEAAAVGKPEKILWATWTYFGIVTTPVFWLLFAARFAHRDHWLPRWARWALWFLPACTLVLVFTNNSHHLIWGEIEFGSDPNTLVYSHGIWFWLHAVYGYLLLLTGTVLLAMGISRSKSRLGIQTLLIILGAAVPWLGNILYVAGWIPLAGLDPTPLALMASGSLIGAAILRFGLFDLIPLARDAVVDGMPDGIIVVDRQDRVVDINPIARSLFPDSQDNFLGRPAGSFFLAWSSISNRLQTSNETHAELQLGGTNPRTMDIRATNLTDPQGHLLGRVIALRDITARIQMELALREVQQELVRNEERYRILVENAPFPVMITAYSGGEILFINPRGEDAFGIAPGTGARKNGLQFYAHPKDREDLLAFFTESPAAIAERTLEFRKLDGTSIRTLISFSRMQFDGQDALFESFVDLEHLTRR